MLIRTCMPHNLSRIATRRSFSASKNFKSLKQKDASWFRKLPFRISREKYSPVQPLPRIWFLKERVHSRSQQRLDYSHHSKMGSCTMAVSHNAVLSFKKCIVCYPRQFIVLEIIDEHGKPFRMCWGNHMTDHKIRFFQLVKVFLKKLE